MYGLNGSDHFLQATSLFLSCSIDSIPFNFLGIQVGSIKVSSWKGLLDDLRVKIFSWKGKLLSIGGRITLINSTLNSISIYLLSFFKAYKVVLKEIIRIQSDYLWLGCEDKKGVRWISWKIVCRSKSEGGLRVRIVYDARNSTRTPGYDTTQTLRHK